MKIVKFLGGLGNQMFQYAFYKAWEGRVKNVTADLTGYKTYGLHNGFELETIFGISVKKAAPFAVDLYNPYNRTWYIRKIRRITGLKNAYYEEQTPYCFDKTIFQDKTSKLYWGYWQNQDYFINIEDQIRTDFQFILPLDSKNAQLLKEIQTSCSISIHIRRGDYLKEELLGGLCPLDYYRKAIELICTQVINPIFFIFSDDIEWSMKNLNIAHKTIFVEGNIGANSYIDMLLMSNCKHNIIANSSFSWWGAWLNKNPKKIVIGPKKWVNNESSNSIVPSTWIKL